MSDLLGSIDDVIEMAESSLAVVSFVVLMLHLYNVDRHLDKLA
jgi:hypothetical protein